MLFDYNSYLHVITIFFYNSFFYSEHSYGWGGDCSHDSHPTEIVSYKICLQTINTNTSARSVKIFKLFGYIILIYFKPKYFNYYYYYFIRKSEKVLMGNE